MYLKNDKTIIFFFHGNFDRSSIVPSQERVRARDRQRDRQTDNQRQTDSQTDRQTDCRDRQTGKTGRLADRQTEGNTDRPFVFNSVEKIFALPYENLERREARQQDRQTETDGKQTETD